jgi:hypothetical protein
MTFKRAIWFPIAALLALGNLVALGFAAGQGEPRHATLHAALALAFGYWARRLQEGPDGGDRQARLEGAEAYEALEALEAEVTKLRMELGDAQERLDFTERMLAQGSESRRVDPQR